MLRSMAHSRQVMARAGCLGKAGMAERVLSLLVPPYRCSYNALNRTLPSVAEQGDSPVGESQAKRATQVPCTDLVQARLASCLTLVRRYIGYPPGYLYSSEAPNVTQTHGYSPRHDDPGGGDEPEDGSHLARQRRGDDGQRKRTCSSNTLEERKRTCTANAVEEW